MVWPLVIMAASSMIQADEQNRQIGRENARRAAEARRQNMVREGFNKREEAVANLNRFLQSHTNAENLKRGARSLSAQYADIVSQLNATRTNSTNRALRSSEVMGQVTASAAASGLMGSTVDQVYSTLELQDASAEEQGARELERTQYILGESAYQFWQGVTDTINTSSIYANIDYNRDVAVPLEKTNVLMAGAMTFAQGYISSGASWFSGGTNPYAGMNITSSLPSNIAAYGSTG
jgi:hypothetical protein